MFDSLAWSVAIRHLRYGVGQSLLTMGVVAISVTLIIFLAALIGGLQKRILATMTGAIPHIVVRQPDREPIASWAQAPSDGPLYVGTTVKLAQQKRKIEDWAVWVPRLANFDPEVIAVSPVVDSQGFLARETKRKGVTIDGVIPECHNAIVDLQSQLISGRYIGLNAGEAVVGFRLADDMGLRIGDKVRLTSDEGNAAAYTIAGIFDTGFKMVDGQTVYITLQDAQSLFGLGKAVTSIGLKLQQVLGADAMAERIKLQAPYDAESWMRDNQSQLAGLRAQSQSSLMIIAFTTVAAAFGIASILITSVVSKIREIGILKAMGATQGQIIRIFAIEGTILALLGGMMGVGLGVGLCLFLSQFRQVASASGRTTEVFPVDLSPGVVGMALAIAVVAGFFASLYPAWRASRINPIEVIRGL